MRRLLVFVVMLSLGHAPAAAADRGPHDADFSSRGPHDAVFASWGGSWGGEETLLQSGQRIARRQAADARTAPSTHSLAAKTRRPSADGAGQAAFQAQTTLSQSGMRKRTKFLIALGIAGAFAGVAYAIDHGVEDSTPSSLGER
jgi:hypothetical protein